MIRYNKLFPIFGFVAGILFSALLFLSSGEKALTESFTELTQRIITIKPNKDLFFCRRTRTAE